MGGNPRESCESQQRWGQRALATSRTQQTAYKDQWELIIENGNAHARAIADLRKEMELLQGELSSQRGEFSGSVSRLDRLVAQQTQRLLEEMQAEMEGSLVRVEKRCLANVQGMEQQVLELLEAKLRQQREVWAGAREMEGGGGGEVWANIRKEQYSHEVYIQDMLRRFSAAAKEHDSRAASVQEHVERLEKELRAFMKEHDTGVVNAKDELCRFCSAIKTGLDARVTCLHERVGDFEKGLDAHVDWVQGELRQLHGLVRRDHEVHSTSFRESTVRVEKELDMHVGWVQGELHCLQTAVKALQEHQVESSRLGHEFKSHVDWAKAEQEARLASSRDWASRLEEQLDSQAAWVQSELSHLGAGRHGELMAHVSRCEKELDGHVGWVKGELFRLGQAVKEGQELAQAELRHLDGKLEGSQDLQRESRQEEARRYTRLESLLAELDSRLLRVQDDLKGHWHKLSVTEHVQCGPAVPRSTTTTCQSELERSPERTWEMLVADQSTRAEDDVVISGSALFGSSPVRTELPSVLEGNAR